MAAKGEPHKSASKLKREYCPFDCGENVLSQNMERRVLQFCSRAKAEATGKDVLKELEKKKREKRGMADIGKYFRQKKREEAPVTKILNLAFCNNSFPNILSSWPPRFLA